MQGNLSNPTVPYYQIGYVNKTFPSQVAPILGPEDVGSSGLCNAYLPTDTALNRCTVSSQPKAACLFLAHYVTKFESELSIQNADVPGL